MRLTKSALLFLVGLTIVLAAVVGATSAYLIDTETSVNNSLTAYAQQIVVKFFAADDEDDGVYRYDSSGNYLDFFSLTSGNSKPEGSAVVGNDLYILDRDDDKVYHYTTAGQYLGVSRRLRESNGSGLDNPYGMAIDGDEMWITEEDVSICRYSLSAAFSGTFDYYAVSSINLDYYTGNRKARGLAIDANYLYVLDNDMYRIWRYLRSNGSPSYSKILRQVDGTTLQEPSGAMFDGTSMWIVDYGKDKAYQYNLSDLFSFGFTINAISEFALNSGNNRAESI
jgi:hypothetical protein